MASISTSQFQFDKIDMREIGFFESTALDSTFVTALSERLYEVSKELDPYL